MSPIPPHRDGLPGPVAPVTFLAAELQLDSPIDPAGLDNPQAELPSRLRTDPEVGA